MREESAGKRAAAGGEQGSGRLLTRRAFMERGCRARPVAHAGSRRHSTCARPHDWRIKHSAYPPMTKLAFCPKPQAVRHTPHTPYAIHGDATADCASKRKTPWLQKNSHRSLRRGVFCAARTTEGHRGPASKVAPERHDHGAPHSQESRQGSRQAKLTAETSRKASPTDPSHLHLHLSLYSTAIRHCAREELG